MCDRWEQIPEREGFLLSLQGPRGERQGMCKGAQRLRKSRWEQIPERGILSLDRVQGSNVSTPVHEKSHSEARFDDYRV